MAQTVQAAYYRGGSSKAVFFHEDDIPPAGPTRDRLLKRIMGTPDPLQIDGMGGSRVVTSKIALIKKSTRPDADIDYTFSQVAITDDTIGYDGNCGNISSAVGPFAIAEGLLDEKRPGASIVDGQTTQEVRIFNTGSKKILVSHVPIDKSGAVIEAGDFSIAAVPGTGAPILMDYSQTIGSSEGKGLLPTSRAIDKIKLEGKEVEITICDVANIIIFVHAQDLNMTCKESADAINSDDVLVARLREIRGKGSVLLGRCSQWEKVDEESPFLPMVVVCERSTLNNADIAARLILDNRCHDSMAGTGAICLTACSRVHGSVVNQLLVDGAAEKKTFNISHPLGIMPVAVSHHHAPGNSVVPEFETLSFIRTARRIMSGQLHVPPEVRFTKEVVTASPNGIAKNMEHESITDQLCDFIARVQYEQLHSDTVEKLKDYILDLIGVAAGAAEAAESSEIFLQAVKALNGGVGSCTVWTKRMKATPQYAGLLNAAYAHSFDFDDTHAEAVLHPGCTVIPAALAQAELSQCDGKRLLTAVATGYEVICRVSRALGTGGYTRGFHNTGTAGIFGAIAAIAVIKNLSSDLVQHAFGIGGSQASGSMQFLENGSWNKRLHPGFAVHNAFVAVALAEAGVVGSAKSIEGRFGFLNAYSDSPSTDGLTQGLGSEWIFEKTAIKPFPACRMTHTAIELAAKISREETDSKVKNITVQLSPTCWKIVGTPDTNKIHPKGIVDAQFSIYYQVAVAWLHGMETGWSAYTNLEDQEIQMLCDKITAIPVEAVKDLEARISIIFEDSEDPREEVLLSPLGEEARPFVRDNVEGKFLGLVKSVYDESTAREIIKVVRSLDQFQAGDLVKLL